MEEKDESRNEKHRGIRVRLFSPSRTAGKRTGLYPDRKRGPWTFLFRYLRLVASFLLRRIRRAVNSIFFSPPISPPFPSSSILASLLSRERVRERERCSFFLVRPVNSKREQKEADARDRWHPVPLFRGKLEEEVAFKIPNAGSSFYRFFFHLCNFPCRLNYHLCPKNRAKRALIEVGLPLRNNVSTRRSRIVGVLGIRLPREASFSLLSRLFDPSPSSRIVRSRLVNFLPRVDPLCTQNLD